MGGWEHRRNIISGAEPALLPLCTQHCSGKTTPVATMFISLAQGPGAAEPAGLLQTKYTKKPELYLNPERTGSDSQCWPTSKAGHCHSHSGLVPAAMDPVVLLDPFNHQHLPV